MINAKIRIKTSINKTNIYFILKLVLSVISNIINANLLFSINSIPINSKIA